MSGNHYYVTYPHTCTICGKKFESPRDNADLCRSCAHKKRGAKVNDVKIERSDAMTPLTLYLVQKWHMEGMCVVEIAAMLYRSSEAIKKALKVKLEPEDYKKMRQYYCKYARRAERMKIWEKLAGKKANAASGNSRRSCGNMALTANAANNIAALTAVRT